MDCPRLQVREMFPSLSKYPIFGGEESGGGVAKGFYNVVLFLEQEGTIINLAALICRRWYGMPIIPVGNDQKHVFI